MNDNAERSIIDDLDREDDLKEVEVDELPKCNFCDKPALYDGKTLNGPWAYMCEEHYAYWGVGLGTGRGQKLKLEEEEHGSK
jgi:hypothetical protein